MAVDGIDRSVVWVRQTITAGSQFNGALPTTQKQNPSGNPRYVEYPPDAVGGLFDIGLENPVPHDDPILRKRGKTKRANLAYKAFLFAAHSAAAFDLLLYITDGVTDTLLIDSNVLTGGTIQNLVVTENDLPIIPPGHWLKLVTVGATVAVQATVGASRAIQGG